MNYYITYPTNKCVYQLCAIDDSGNYFLGTPSYTPQLAVSGSLNPLSYGSTTIEQRCTRLATNRGFPFYYVGPYSSPSEIIPNHPELLL